MKLSKDKFKDASNWKLTMVQLNGETKFIYKPINAKGRVILAPQVIENLLEQPSNIEK